MFLTLIVFIIILGFLVFVHEFGHFVVARKMGVRADEFGFGFPPRAIGIQKRKDGKWRIIFGNKPVSDFEDGGTIYSLNWVPLGGFVKIKGESGEYHHDEDSFASRKIWQRSSILSAGVIMNVVAAVIVLSIGFTIGLPRIIDEDDLSSYARIKDRRIEVVKVLEGSPAAQVGLELGDVILGADGQIFESGKEFSLYLKDKLNTLIVFEIKRNSEIIKKETIPAILTATGEPGIGIGFVEIGNVSYSPPLALWYGFLETGFYIKEIIRAFGGIIYNLIIGEKVAIDVAGPVGIAVFTGRVARLGFVYLLQFTALLSVNLALINIFPFPALDGGRLFFLGLEAVRRRPISQRLENLAHNIGFALLMVLVIFVTYRDIARFGGGVLDKIKTLIQ